MEKNKAQGTNKIIMIIDNNLSNDKEHIDLYRKEDENLIQIKWTKNDYENNEVSTHHIHNSRFSLNMW